MHSVIAISRKASVCVIVKTKTRCLPEFSWWPLSPSNVFDVIWNRASNGDASFEFRLPFDLFWASHGRTILCCATASLSLSLSLSAWRPPLAALALQSLWDPLPLLPFAGLWLRISEMEKDFTPAGVWPDGDSTYTTTILQNG